MENDESIECAICMTELNTQDITKTYCCKQQLHTKCYIDCLKKTTNNTCPFCRTYISYYITPPEQQILPIAERQIIVIETERPQSNNVNLPSKKVCFFISCFICSIYTFTNLYHIFII